MRDILGYQGKCVVVTGAASGMGAAAARTLVELGAEVHALDVKPIEAPVKQSVPCDLSKAESIDAAVAKLPARVDRLFNCAGLPGAAVLAPRHDARELRRPPAPDRAPRARASPRAARSRASRPSPGWAGSRTSTT